jgi:hypothetical protein
MNWLHRLFNPHCPHCEIAVKCESCETLRSQLSLANHEKDQLLKYILEPRQEFQAALPTVIHDENVESIKPKIVPWHVRKQMLETEDRRQAELLRESKKNVSAAVEELERNLGIVSETSLDLDEGKVNVQS